MGPWWCSITHTVQYGHKHSTHFSVLTLFCTHTQDISGTCPPPPSCPPGTNHEEVNVAGQCCPNYTACTGCELRPSLANVHWTTLPHRPIVVNSCLLSQSVPIVHVRMKGHVMRLMTSACVFLATLTHSYYYCNMSELAIWIFCIFCPHDI